MLSVLEASWLGVAVWNLKNNSVGMGNYFDPWVSLALIAVVFAALGLYSPAGVGPVEELRRLVLGSSLVWLALTSTVFLAGASLTYSRGAVLVSATLMLLFAPVNRALIRQLLGRKAWWGVPVLVLGSGEPARAILEGLQAQAGMGLKPVLCIDNDPGESAECAGIPVASPLALAPRLASELDIRHALVAIPDIGRRELDALLENSGGIFANIIVIPNLFGVAGLWVTARDLGGVLGLELRQNLLIPWNRRLKRLLDVCAAAILGVAVLPAVALAAAVIRILSPGPVFYAQEREGQHGRPIRIYKLRTMYTNAGQLLQQHLDRDPDARREWRRFFKLKNDPRVLPVIGAFLRRSSLDEIPQLLNVLHGEMSLVGPRPFPHYHLDEFGARFRDLRSQVVPGLTGLWQISARSNGDLKVQETLDSYYIRNWSLWLDLHILLRTFAAVVLSRGAY